MNNQKFISNLFKGDDFFYVTTDVKRALGLEDVLPNFHIITSLYDPFISFLRNKNINVYCIEEEIQKGNILPKSSQGILAYTKVKEYISKKSKKPLIISFKPSEGIDKICKENKLYKYICNSRELNEEFEDKIRFYEIIKKNFKKNTIPSIIGKYTEFAYKTIAQELGGSIVIQFGKGWAGNTTFFVENEKDFEDLKKQFPQTVVRISKRIIGNTFLNNCCIYQNQVLQSSPAVQISGISWLNTNPSATVGREWGNTLITSDQENEIKLLTAKIGEILIKSRYRGYFGLDFIIDSKSGDVYISELNARFTASTPFYTKLELGCDVLPLYIYHLAEFLEKDIKMGYAGCEAIEGGEVNLKSPISNFETGTYKIEDDRVLKFKNDSYDPNNLQKEKEMVLITDRKNSTKIQTNYPVLETPGKFQEKFETVLKGILINENHLI